MAENETTTKVEETESSEGESSDLLSVDSLDAIIAAEDPEFAKSLDEIKVDSADIPVEIAEDGLDLEYTYEAEKKKWQEAGGLSARLARWFPLGPWISFQSRLRVTRLRLSLIRRKKKIIYVAKNLKPLTIQALKNSIQGLKSFISFVVSTFKEMRVVKKILFVLLVAATGAAGFFLFKMMSHGLIPEHQELFISSLSEWAQEKHQYDQNAPQESFYESTRTSQNIILLKKMIVNLRRSAESGANPMAAFDFLVEGAASEVVIEIKDREPEVRDLFMRTMEEMTFEQLSSGEGKKMLCDRLKKEINTILTQGFVRRVFIKTAIVKP